MVKSDGIWVTKTGRIYRVNDEIETPAELQALLDDLEGRWLEIADDVGNLLFWGQGFICAYQTHYNGDNIISYPATLKKLPPQPYAETPQEFPLSACAAGLERGEEWQYRWIPDARWEPQILTGDFRPAINVYRPAPLGPILYARKAAEEAEKRTMEILSSPEACQEPEIPPCPQGMTFEEAWKLICRKRWVQFPWPEDDEKYSEAARPTSVTWGQLKAVAERFGPNCFYKYEDGGRLAKAHGEWLRKYGGLG